MQMSDRLPSYIESWTILIELSLDTISFNLIVNYTRNLNKLFLELKEIT